MFELFNPRSAGVGLIVSVLLGWIITGLIRLYRRRKMLSGFTRIPGWPLVGNAVETVMYRGAEYDSLVTGWLTCYARHGVVRITLLHEDFLILCTADKVQQVLSSSIVITKAWSYDFLHPWLKTGLLTSTGGKWHSRRKLLTPAFHMSILKDFLDVFVEHSNTMVGKLRQTCGTEIDMFPFASLCTLDSISETAMGVKINAQKESDSPYVQSIYTLTKTLWIRMNTPYMWPRWLFSLTPTGRRHDKALKLVSKFTKKVIEDRKQEFMSASNDKGVTSKKRMAFLDLLLHMSEEGSALSMEDIQEEVDTFMFEGHDTTSSALCWTVHFIAANQDIQEELVKEQRQIFGGSEPMRTTPDDLKRMDLLERVIKESLRLFPSVPLLGRTLLEEGFTIDGQEIPVGTTFLISPQLTHRDGNIFPDPQLFDPDRFLPDNSVGRHPFAYIPFSAGPRNCIGQRFAMMELKVMLAALVRNFHVTTRQKREDMRSLLELINRPENGVLITLSPRKGYKESCL